MSASGSEWPISSSVILSTAAADLVRLDTLFFSKSESRGTFRLLFSEGNFDQSLELSSNVETLSLTV